MNPGLSPKTIALLVTPPLMWSANAIVGRMVHELVSPMTLNFVRWVLALAFLLPLGGEVLRRASPVWPLWKRYAVLGLLGVGMYNSMQYLALQTSTPINVTLVASGIPVLSLLVGWLFYRQPVTRRQILGAALSLAGVLLVLCRGQWELLMAVRFVQGDVAVLVAIIAWAFYGWQLTVPKDPPEVKADWAAFLCIQIFMGVLWSGLFTGIEWSTGHGHITWTMPLVAAILFVALGPSLLAYRAWGRAVQIVGPSVAGVFSNLTPLLAALMSAAFLGEPPHLYHAVAFLLLVAGIVVSLRR